VSRRYDLVVLGGGTGGLISSVIAAGVGARVGLIERDRIGGDCLWTGCVPSKSLVAAAGLAHRMRHADAVGLAPVTLEIDFERVMQHVWGAIRTIEPHDSPARLQRSGTSGSWPDRLVVLGGGPIGCELGQAFARLGSRVTLVEMADRLLPREDPRASELIASRLTEDGVDVRVRRRAREARKANDGGHELELDGPDGSEPVAFDRILVATGRFPRTDGLGLDTVGVRVDERGAVVVDPRLRTSARGIFAVGDATGLLPFTHVAAHHARIATPNALFHTRGKVSDTIPWVTFTDPEVGRVGMTEAEARERWGDRVVIAQSDYASLDRAITAGDAYGFAKLVAGPRGRLLGATVAAPGGGEAIAELTAWVTRGEKIDAVSQTVHAYPTLAEGPARAADDYLAARYSTPRLRALTRPVLAALRLLER
jgi:pyruvate/2-oxoglutarate dehydrogenase complex dihydrolipoamide dehydrogenase (E3) component